MEIFKLTLLALILAAVICLVSAVCPDILDKELPLVFEAIFYGGAIAVVLWLLWRGLK